MKDILDTIKQFTVQKTLFSVIHEQAEKMSIKYYKEGLTDAELEEYEKLIEEIGGSTRQLIDTITPLFEAINKKMDQDIEEKNRLIMNAYLRFDALAAFMEEKGLMDEAIDYVAKYEAEHGPEFIEQYKAAQKEAGSPEGDGQ